MLLYYPLKKKGACPCLPSLGWSADSSIGDQLKNHSAECIKTSHFWNWQHFGVKFVYYFNSPAWIHLHYTNVMYGDTAHVPQGKKKAVFSLSRQASPVLPAVHLSQPHRYLRLQGGDSTFSLVSQGRIGDDPLFWECRIWGQDGFFSPIRFLDISRNKLEGWGLPEWQSKELSRPLWQTTIWWNISLWELS